MDYLKEAQTAAEQAKLAEWLKDYIKIIEPNNLELHAYIDKHASEFRGPEKVPMAIINRTLGPEPEMLRQENPIEFTTSVQNIKNTIQTTIFKKFLLAEYDGQNFYLLDGNHTLEALKEMGHHECFLVYLDSKNLAEQALTHISTARP